MKITDLYDATEAVLAAREAFAAAEAAKRSAEVVFMDACEAAGVTFVETSDGLRVAVEHRPTRKIDLDVLTEHLAADVLDRVLKATVDTKAFDAAVKVALIPAEVADKAVTVTTAPQVRVYGEAGVKGDRS